MDPARSAEKSSAARRIVQADDLHTLYELVRGSPYANSLVEAQDAFAAGNFSQALLLVRTVQGQYSPKHRRLVQKYQAERQNKKRPDPKLQSRIDKIHQTLELFDTVVPALERVAKVEPPQQNSAPSDTRSEYDEAAQLTWIGSGSRLPHALRNELAHATSLEDALAAIARYADTSPVTSREDVVSDAFYQLQLKDAVHIIRTSSRLPITDLVPLRHAILEQPLKPLKLETFLDLGRKGKLARITLRTSPAADEARPEQPLPLGLNMGDFSQLMDAAQHSGLVPNADAIAHLRDREFRIGDYQKALQDMEALFGKFVTAAAQREQRLRREETDIKSGKVQMSARDLQIKRARDQADSQRIARARRRFQRVLEGLRMLASKIAE